MIQEFLVKARLPQMLTGHVERSAVIHWYYIHSCVGGKA